MWTRQIVGFYSGCPCLFIAIICSFNFHNFTVIFNLCKMFPTLFTFCKNVQVIYFHFPFQIQLSSYKFLMILFRSTSNIWIYLSELVSSKFLVSSSRVLQCLHFSDLLGAVISHYYFYLMKLTYFFLVLLLNILYVLVTKLSIFSKFTKF